MSQETYKHSGRRISKVVFRSRINNRGKNGSAINHYGAYRWVDQTLRPTFQVLRAYKKQLGYVDKFVSSKNTIQISLLGSFREI